MISDTIQITTHNCLLVDKTVTSLFINYIIKQLRKEIKGSGEQLLTFLQTLGSNSVSIDLSMQAVVLEGVYVTTAAVGCMPERAI